MNVDPVVLVPGLACTHALFARQAAVLQDRRPVIIGRHTEHDDMAAIAAAILASAPPRFVLGGLSMGGYVAFEIMAQAPERVSRLVLFDTSARADTPQQSENRQRLIALAEADGLAAVMAELLPKYLPADRLGDEALVATIRAMAEATGVAAFVRQQRAIMGRPDRLEQLAAISCPTLVVVGEHDALTPVELAEEIAGGISAARLEIVPAAGHLVPLEQPKIVNALIIDWLAEQT